MPVSSHVQLAPNAAAALEQVACLLKRDWHATQVVLFGSRARGNAEPDADYDLLVLLPGEPQADDWSAIRRAVIPIEVAHDTWIDLLVLSADSWHHGAYRAAAIRHEVARDGLAL